MTKLILVRHSQSDARPDVPTHQWGLTAEGQRRAEVLADLLEPYVPFVLASSPEPKARQTAEAIARVYDLEIEEIADLREHDRQTVPWMDSADSFRDAVIRFLQQPNELVLGEETGGDALERFTYALRNLIAHHADTNIVAVTHGSVITLFAAEFADAEPVTFWESLTQPWYGVFDVPGFALIEAVAEIGIEHP